MRILKPAVIFYLLMDLLDIISTVLVLRFVPGAQEQNGLMLVGGVISMRHVLYLKCLGVLELVVLSKFIHIATHDDFLTSLPIWWMGYQTWAVAFANFGMFALLLK